MISLGCWTADFPGLRGSEPETATTGRDLCSCLAWLPPAWRVTAVLLMSSTGWTSTWIPQVRLDTPWSESNLLGDSVICGDLLCHNVTAKGT